MPQKKPLPLSIVLFFTLSGLLSCNGCKTKPNVNDATPPVIEWTVLNQTTGANTQLTGTAKMSVPENADIVVTACVVDDGGVKEITSGTGSSYACSQGNVTQGSGPGLSVKETSPLGLDENGMAWKRFCRLYSTKLSFGCPDGYFLTSAWVSFTLSGKNYAGLSATGTLTLTVSH